MFVSQQILVSIKSQWLFSHREYICFNSKQAFPFLFFLIGIPQLRTWSAWSNYKERKESTSLMFEHLFIPTACSDTCSGGSPKTILNDFRKRKVSHTYAKSESIYKWLNRKRMWNSRLRLFSNWSFSDCRIPFKQQINAWMDDEF